MLVDPDKPDKPCKCNEKKKGLVMGEGCSLMANIGNSCDTNPKICISDIFVPLTDALQKNLTISPKSKRKLDGDVLVDSGYPSLVILKICDNKSVYLRNIHPLLDNTETINYLFEIKIKIDDVTSSNSTGVVTVKLTPNLQAIILDWINSFGVDVNGIDPDIWNNLQSYSWSDLSPLNLSTSLDAPAINSEFVIKFYDNGDGSLIASLKKTISDANSLLNYDIDITMVYNPLTNAFSYTINSINLVGDFTDKVVVVNTTSSSTLTGNSVDATIAGEFRSIYVYQWKKITSLYILSSDKIFDMELYNPNDSKVDIKVLMGVNNP